MAARKFRPRIVKAEVAALASVVGVTEAERQTGIAKETIHYWLKDPEFARLRTTAREQVVEQFWAGIQIGTRAVLEGLESNAPLRDKALALATLVDRYALLNGEATARTETKALTDDLSDDEKQRLRQWIVDLPAAVPDPRPAG